jgi:uncharacterized metal-binding protein YceD (DUF177 family)
VNEKTPWRATVAVAEIPEAGLHRDIEAGEAERNSIAATAAVRELPRLGASFDLVHAGGGRVHVSGRVTATVGRTCVVTLEPMTTEIDEPVDVMFAPEAEVAASLQSGGDEAALADEPPEPIVHGEINLGALAAEFLILALDPYPRKPGVVFEPVIAPPDPADHPFAALGSLKSADSAAKPRKSKGK